MTAFAAIGTIISWNGSAIPQLTKVDGPNPKVDFVETTALDSTGGKKTRIPSLVDEGEISFEGVWDPDNAVHQALRADCLAKTARQVIVTNTDTAPPTTITAAVAYVAELNYPRELSGALKFSGKIIISGATS